MTKKNWEDEFISTINDLSDGLLEEAKQKKNYGEAIKYLKRECSKISGDGDLAQVTMRVSSAIRDYTISRIYDETKKLPIQRGEEQ